MTGGVVPQNMSSDTLSLTEKLLKVVQDNKYMRIDFHQTIRETDSDDSGDGFAYCTKSKFYHLT